MATPLRLRLLACALVVVTAACGPISRIDRGVQAEGAGSGGQSVGATGGAGGGAGGAGQGGQGGAGGEGSSGVGGSDGPPAPPARCGEVGPWMEGKLYEAGDRVAAGLPVHLYECRPWPNSGWCPLPAYEPGKIADYWPDAWTDAGPCPTP